MLDENLPTFYLRSSRDNVKHHATVLLAHHGSDAHPVYSIRHPDPATPVSRNRYAVALCDTFSPEIIYGEVLLTPDWTQPSQDDVRQHDGTRPPPQPVLPTEFVVQLYNPDQQVKLKWSGGSWSSSPFWEFEMPAQSFRLPSTSALDRTQNDPTLSETTPKLGFKWKKEGTFTKEYVCSLSGKSTNPDGSKRKHKEPDITVAMFKSLKEITIYEPNLSRVEMEDHKGLEVVLILSAVVLREVFTTGIQEAFNISEPPPIKAVITAPPSKNPHVKATMAGALVGATSGPSPPKDGRAQVTAGSRPPPTDARSQWELDMEAARLKKQVASEEREQKKRDAAEAKKVQKMLDEEERQRKERQKQVDRETERLKKIYGAEEQQSRQRLSNSPRPAAPPSSSSSQQRPQRPSQQQIQAAPATNSQSRLWSNIYPSRPRSQQANAPAAASSSHLSLPVTAYPPAPIRRPHSANPVPYIASNLRPASTSALPNPSLNYNYNGRPPVQNDSHHHHHHHRPHHSTQGPPPSQYRPAPQGSYNQSSGRKPSSSSFWKLGSDSRHGPGQPRSAAGIYDARLKKRRSTGF